MVKLPDESLTSITGCIVNESPTNVSFGSDVMASWVAVPAVMSKLLLVAELRPEVVAVKV